MWIISDGNSSIYSLASEEAIVYFWSGDKKLKALKKLPYAQAQGRVYWILQGTKFNIGGGT